jgi:transposase
VKNVPGRKSDVADCQWLQYLHSVGLLQGSFRPPQAVCAVRALWSRWPLATSNTCRKPWCR